jgi:acyl-coenzyme A thioesterase PaaI-like protein
MSEKTAPVMTVDDLTDFMRDTFPEQAYLVVDRLTERGLVLRLAPRPADLRPGGSLLGAAIFNLADVGVYLAILSRIGPKALTVTTGASIDYMRKPFPGRDLLAEVEILKLGRALAVGEARLHSEGEMALIARATMTFSVPPADRNMG